MRDFLKGPVLLSVFPYTLRESLLWPSETSNTSHGANVTCRSSQWHWQRLVVALLGLQGPYCPVVGAVLADMGCKRSGRQAGPLGLDLGHA